MTKRAATAGISETHRTVLLYLRQSLDRDGAGLAVNRQEVECRALADRLGLTVAATFTDNSISASKGRRPAFEAMLAALGRGEGDGVLAYAVDRITRTVLDLERLIELDRPIWCVSGSADLTTPLGRAAARIGAVLARSEIEQKSARQVSANRDRAARGVPHGGGPRTPGYTPRLAELVPSEAALISDAYSALLGGASLRSVARGWNEAGMTTGHGNRWNPRAVRDALRNPRYAALSAYQARTGAGEVLAPGNWPAVVTEETWRAVQHLLADPARRTTPDTARQYLLSGLARCHCGAVVQSGRTSTGTRTYRCSRQPGHLSRGAEPLDVLVLGVVAERLARGDVADLLPAATAIDTRGLLDEARALRVRLDELVDLHIAGGVTGAQLARGTATVERRLAEIDAELESAATSSVLGPLLATRNPAEAFLALDVERRRRVLSELVTIKLFAPGRGARSVDPRTVDVDWPKRR